MRISDHSSHVPGLSEYRPGSGALSSVSHPALFFTGFMIQGQLLNLKITVAPTLKGEIRII